MLASEVHSSWIRIQSWEQTILIRGSLYTIRTLYALSNSISLSARELEKNRFQVEKGEGLSPVTSCEGLSVPVYFYLEIVWISTIFTAYILFCYAVHLGNGIKSGIIAILLFFYNHNECTRVQWSPPLRESFAYPVLLGQMYLLTVILRKGTVRDSQNVPRDLLQVRWVVQSNNIPRNLEPWS